MKTIKYFAIASVLSFSLSACDIKRNSATLGGTQDTASASAGSNAGGTSVASSADTAKNSNKNAGKSSTSNGNANPTGHMQNDTVHPDKNHRPK